MEFTLISILSVAAAAAITTLVGRRTNKRAESVENALSARRRYLSRGKAFRKMDEILREAINNAFNMEDVSAITFPEVILESTMGSAKVDKPLDKPLETLTDGKHRRLKIIAPGGEGKTVFLLCLMHHYLKRAKKQRKALAFYVALKKIDTRSETDGMVVRYILERYFDRDSDEISKKDAKNFKEFVLGKWARRFTILFLLDGFNETNRQGAITSEIGELTRNLVKETDLRVVITSRYDAGLPRDMERVRLGGFHNVQEMLSGEVLPEGLLPVLKTPLMYAIYVEKTQKERDLARERGAGGIARERGAGGTPLGRGAGGAPLGRNAPVSSRAALLDAYFQLEEDAWTDGGYGGHGGHDLMSFAVSVALPEIAYGMWLEKSNKIECVTMREEPGKIEKALRATIERAFPNGQYDFDSLLDYLTITTGMLRCEKQKRVRSYSFVHLLFQDYFCAKYIYEDICKNNYKDIYRSALTSVLSDDIKAFLVSMFEEDAAFIAWNYRGERQDLLRTSPLCKLLSRFRMDYEDYAKQDAAIAIRNILDMIKGVRGGLYGINCENLDLSGYLFNNVLLTKHVGLDDSGDASRFCVVSSSFYNCKLDAGHFLPQGHMQWVLCLLETVIHEKPFIVSGDRNGEVKFWPMDQDYCESSLSLCNSPITAITSLARADSDPLILCANGEGEVFSLDGASGHAEKLDIAQFPKGAIKRMKALHGEAVIAVAFQNGAFGFLKIARGKSGSSSFYCVCKLDEYIHDFAFDMENSRFVLGTEDKRGHGYGQGLGQGHGYGQGHGHGCGHVRLWSCEGGVSDGALEKNTPCATGDTQALPRELIRESFPVTSVDCDDHADAIFFACKRGVVRMSRKSPEVCAPPYVRPDSPNAIPVLVRRCPGRDKFVAAYDDNTVVEWAIDADDDPIVTGRHSDEIMDILCDESHRCISCSKDTSIKIINLDIHVAEHNFQGMSYWIKQFAVHAGKENLLFIPSIDATIQKFSLDRQRRLDFFEGQEGKRHEERIYALDILPGRERLLSASLDRRIGVWRMDSWQAEAVSALCEDGMEDLAVLDGKRFVSIDSSNNVYLWEYEDDLRKLDQQHPGGIKGTKMEGRGANGVYVLEPLERIASVHWDGSVNIWKIEENKLRHTDGPIRFSPEAEPVWVYCVLCCAVKNGPVLTLASTRDGKLHIFQGEQFTRPRTLVIQENCSLYRMVERGGYVYISASDGRVYAVSLSDISDNMDDLSALSAERVPGTELHVKKDKGGDKAYRVFSLAAIPHSDQIITYAEDGLLRVCEVNGPSIVPLGSPITYVPGLLLKDPDLDRRNFEGCNEDDIQRIERYVKIS